MNFITLNKSENLKYALVIIDSFSKWTEIFPTENAEALTKVKAPRKDIIPR